VHELAMPTIGRARSASPKPIAFRYDRAGARSRPSRRTRLRWRGSDGMGAHGNAARRGRPVSRESRRRPPAGAAWDRVSVAALALLVERLLAALAELPWFLAPLAFPSALAFGGRLLAAMLELRTLLHRSPLAVLLTIGATVLPALVLLPGIRFGTTVHDSSFRAPEGAHSVGVATGVPAGWPRARAGRTDDTSCPPTGASALG